MSRRDLLRARRVARALLSPALAVALPLAMLACSGGDREQAQTSPGNPSGDAAHEAGPTLEVANAVGLGNARMPRPGLLTGGQPTNAQLEALAEAGYTHFISLRPEEEAGGGWEEADAAAHAHDFDRLAIAGAGDLTRENVEAFAALLREAGDAPTVIYCASGNRVGAMLALKAAWIDGVAPEEALRLGLDAGMTRLEAPVRQLLGLSGSP